MRDLSPFSGSNYLETRDQLNKNINNSFLISANPILAPPGGYGHLNYSSEDDAKNKVRDLVENGVDIIKLSIEDDLQGRTWKMPLYKEVESIVNTAHSKNKKVSVHLTHIRNLKWAIDAGVDDIAHMAVEPVDPDTINQIIKKNIYWVPTLELWKGVSIIHSLKWDRIAIDNLRSFYTAGGKIALGTDFAGYTCDFDKGFPITEVTLMKEAGMSNMDIIIAATRNAAYVCGLDQKIGTVEAGKDADLLIVDGDPLSDIYALTKTKMVIHKGMTVKK